MAIVRDGEKYACKQCIQGHRVSGCNHTDRPLLHVNKKGRPVSQCPHCRGLRKARQTHVKCECGERRHSRNNSSESASLDEGGCSCFAGKKCTCALKKEIQDDNKRHGPSASPPGDRSSPMRWIPARRSESAIPGMRGASASALYKRQGSQDLGLPFAAQQPYQLGRGPHAAQRSVDSLPLGTQSSSQYQPMAPLQAYDTQFLTPDTAMQPLRSAQSWPATFSDQPLGDFPVQLDPVTIERTLSPHNTKRYSMNDFSILAGMSQQFSDQQMYTHNAPSDSATFPFPDFSTQDFSFPGSSMMSGPQRGDSMTSTDAPFPALSRSSSGTASEPIDWTFSNAEAKPNALQPVITIDPSWNLQSFDDSEKSAFEHTPSSYQDTPSDYTSPFDDATLSTYRVDNTQDLNPFSTEPRFGGMNDFPFPTNETAPIAQFQALPDRSAPIPTSVPESMLESDFKFPNQDVPAMDGFGMYAVKQTWSPRSENEMME